MDGTWGGKNAHRNADSTIPSQDDQILHYPTVEVVHSINISKSSDVKPMTLFARLTTYYCMYSTAGTGSAIAHFLGIPTDLSARFSSAIIISTSILELEVAFDSEDQNDDLCSVPNRGARWWR